MLITIFFIMDKDKNYLNYPNYFRCGYLKTLWINYAQFGFKNFVEKTKLFPTYEKCG